MYSILARGYLFHDAGGNVLDVNPKCKIDLARRALLAWCSIPDSKKPPLKRSGSNLICRKQQFPFFYARFDDEAYL